MDAVTVHTISRALPKEELERLYELIGKDLSKNKKQVKRKSKKTPLISDLEARNILLEKVFKVNINPDS